VAELFDRRRLVVDDGWRIIGEYRSVLQSDGQPTISQRFLKWVLTNHTNTALCEKVAIAQTSSGEFVDFPADRALTAFDRSDRKFIAVAVAQGGSPEVWQATDTKWLGFEDVLRGCGVNVNFLCVGTVEGQRASARRRN
jgi:hypothetical protein